MINQLTFTKHYDTFDNVSKIYSDKFPQGKDLDLLHIVLYFRFLSYQENNLNCYESHETLAKIFKSSASTIKRKINDLKEMGLLETSPHPDPYISSLIYNALPLTDAHITPQENHHSLIFLRQKKHRNNLKAINSLLLMFLMMIGIRLYPGRRKKHLFHQVKR